MLQNLTAILIAYGIWGVFLLGLTDSAGIPVPGGMDLLLIAVAASSPSRAWLAAGMAVIGSAIGNLLLYWICRKGGGRMADYIPEPGSRSHRFRAAYRRYGLVTIFIPAVVPIVPLPLKVFVISAGVLRTSWRSFLSVVILARFLRFFALAYLGSLMGKEGALNLLARSGWTLAAIAIGLASFLYLLIRLNDRYAPEPSSMDCG